MVSWPAASSGFQRSPKTSERSSRRCMRTSTGSTHVFAWPCASRSPTPPKQRATCGMASISLSHAKSVNTPSGVSTLEPCTGSMRRTSPSMPRRWRMICSTLHILRPCCAHMISRSGTRAISPSSRTTSMMAAAGFRPARRQRSTLPSVCPVRTSTPPSRARSGLMWPGRTKSSARIAGSMSIWMVLARSLALMPVPTPWRGWPSTLTVKGVPRRLVLLVVCGCRSRRSQVSPSRLTHR